MIPFSMVVRKELTQSLTKMALPDQNHSVKTSALDRSHKPLRVGVGVSRQLHRRRAVGRKPFELPIPSIPQNQQHYGLLAPLCRSALHVAPTRSAAQLPALE